jgi:acyl-coenzyme A thioesterase PaaI-like protein
MRKAPTQASNGTAWLVFAREDPMTTFTAPDPDYAARCAESFGRQAFLHFLGGTVESLAPGRAVLRLPFRSALAQQHGFFHAGSLTTLADTAAG